MVWVLVTIVTAVSVFGAGKKALESGSEQNANSVWVLRPDGSQSCGMKAGQTTEEAGEELKKAGVQLLDSMKGTDGKMHAMMCGMPEGKVNAYLIPEKDLLKAESLGFKRAPSGFGK